MKTYVLMLSKYFPAKHALSGTRTWFAQKVLAAVNKDDLYRKKIHTIRDNYPLWKQRIEQVQSGLAILSIRQWSGKPYCSKQIEIVRLGKDDGVGIQQLTFGSDRYAEFSLSKTKVDGHFCDPVTLAFNDGLLNESWREWFKNYDLSKPMAIIHFTPYRYHEK